MRRYQKLILDAVEGRWIVDGITKEKIGYANLSRDLGAPSSSIHEWATFPNKVPQYKSLEKVAEYFKVPLPTLLMDADDLCIPIVDVLYGMKKNQKKNILKLIREAAS